jgi:hypothetical protein
MNNKAVLEFELGLWSLKSLYTLQNSLKSTIDSLLEAKEKLVAQINCVSFPAVFWCLGRRGSDTDACV